MSLEFKGKLIKVLPSQTGTGKKGNWVKQDFVLETLDQYPKQVCFTAFGEDKVKELENVVIGCEINVFFNIESREYNEKYYTNITVWKFGFNNSAPQTVVKKAPEQVNKPTASLPSFSESDQDLPF